MVGASDGRTYQSQQRFGVSVFDFKMPRADKDETEDGKVHPRFVGYATFRIARLKLHHEGGSSSPTARC